MSSPVKAVYCAPGGACASSVAAAAASRQAVSIRADWASDSAASIGAMSARPA